MNKKREKELMRPFLFILLGLLFVSIASADGTSLNAVELNISDFNFSSSDYVTKILVTFNTSLASEHLVLLSSMNIKKLTGDSSNQVSVNVSVDGAEVSEQNLRSISLIGDEGSTGTSPIHFNMVSAGEHNLSVQFKRTNDGSISVNDIDLVLISLRTIDGGMTNHTMTSGSYQHNSTDYVSAFNFTINKTVLAPHFLLTKKTVQSNRTDISYYPSNQGTSGNINMSSNIVLYHFNETSGNPIDYSGQSNDANSARNVVRGISGIFGEAFEFNGIDARVSLPDSDDFPDEHIDTDTHTQETIEIWFKVYNKSAEKQIIYEFGSASEGMNFYVQEDKLYVGAWDHSGGWGTWLSTRSISSNKWHQVVLTLNGTSSVAADAVKGYLDGVEFGSGEGAQLGNLRGRPQIGRSNGWTRAHDGIDSTSGDYFNGSVDEFAIYNSTLSAQEILSRYDSITSRVGYYFKNLDDLDVSGTWERYFSGPEDTGSVSGCWVETDFVGSSNMTLQSKNYYNATTTVTTLNILSIDLSNNNSVNISNFQADNINTNTTNSVNYTAGLHNLANATVNITNATGYLLAMSSSFKSASGNFTPIYYINSTSVDTSNCYSKKERYLESNSDLGNAFIYTICRGLTPDTNYTFNLWLEVPAGETVIQVDESLSGFGITELDTTQGNLAPVPNEISVPGSATYHTGYKNITWSAFSDPNSDDVNYTIFLENSSLSQTLTSNTSLVYYAYNFSTREEGSYNMTVQACDTSSLCANSTSTFVIDKTAPTLTSSSPANEASVDSSSGNETTLNCSVADGYQLENISLYMTNSSNQNYSFVESVSISGTSRDYSFVRELADGTYTWSCLTYDVSGNSLQGGNRTMTMAAATAEDVVEDTTTTSSSGGVPSYSIIISELQEGYTKSLGRLWKINFKYEDESHQLKVNSFDANNKTATITISSEPQTKTLSDGEEWKVNIDGDNYYDLLVRLDGVTSLRANIFMQTINESISDEVEVIEEDDSPIVEYKKKFDMFWFIVSLVVIITLLTAGYLIFRNSKKKGKKRKK